MANTTTTKDTVFVRNVSIQAEIGLDAWGRPKPQPALISVRLSFSMENAGITDNIDDCMDYRKIYKAITAFDDQKVSGPVELAKQVCSIVMKAVNGTRIETTVTLPKGLLQSEGISIDMTMSRLQHIEESHLSVHKLVIPCVIGIGAHERPRKQPVIVDLRFYSEDLNLNDEGVYGGLATENILMNFDRIFQTFEVSQYLTLEAFVAAMSRFVLLELNTGLAKVTVSAYKPAVFAAAEGPGVEITRTLGDVVSQKTKD